MLTPEKIKAVEDWVEKHKENFPKTLDAETMYYNDVSLTAELWATQLHSKNESAQMTAYGKLRGLFRDLKNKSNWNKPYLKIEDLK
jgi:hypothetical protein